MRTTNTVFYLVLLMLFGITDTTLAGLLKDQTLTIDGSKRTYDLYIPSSTPSAPSPLVLLLHGHFGSADAMTGENNKKAPYKVWLTIAERENWFLLIPDGEIGPDDHRGWNDCRGNAKTNPNTDDVAFLNKLTDLVSSEHPIDKSRIYVHGTSNGGNMAYRLAQESGDRFRAIAAVVAAMPEQNKCRHLGHPISVLIMNGTEDPILPYEGGGVGKRKSHQEDRGSVLSTAESLKYWLTNNEITSQPVTRKYPDINKRDKSTVHTKQYFNKKNDTEVILFEIRGGGHTEPSLTEHYSWLYSLIVGRQNRDIEMAEEVWKFFDRQ